MPTAEVDRLALASPPFSFPVLLVAPLTLAWTWDAKADAVRRKRKIACPDLP